MNRSLQIIALLLCCTAVPLLSQTGAPVATYALVNGAVETVTNGRIAKGIVVVRNGRIEAVGPDLAIPEGAEVIDCSGLTIYPGMIDAGTQLGLIEIGSIDETRDADEMGDITPQALALTAVNPNSVSIPVTRVHGVTTVLTRPSGGLLPGTAALINLNGYTPEQMSVGGTQVLMLNFPSSARGGWWDERTDEEVRKEWKNAYDKLEEVWDRAEIYSRIDSAYYSGTSQNRGEKGSNVRLPEYVPQISALLPAIRRDMAVMIEVNHPADIDSAIAWAQRRNVRAILSGLEEGWRVADQIARSGYPCVVGPVLAIPERSSDRYDKAYANAGLLSKAGCLVAIRTSDVENVRNLPYQAGFAIAYGMEKEEGLRSVTINPARIFGVDSILGSLEPGKQATLFATDGDPFEPSSHVRFLMINGRPVALSSRQTELKEEFWERGM